MRRHEVLKTLFLVLFVTAYFLSYPNDAAAQKRILLTYAQFFPPGHKHSITTEAWCREIEKRTKGRVSITSFYGEMIVPVKNIYDGVVKGVVDIGFSTFTYTKGKFPLMELIDLPIGLKDGMMATRLINAYYEKFRPKEIDEVKVLYLHAHGPNVIHTKRPVRKLEDIKGMKIRVAGLGAHVVTALGAVPVATETTMLETYDVLRKGIAEGAISPFEALQGFKWGEFIRYSTIAEGSGYSTGMFVIMNKDRWNSLPLDIQKLFTEVSKEWIEKQGRVWVEVEKQGRDFARKSGITITTLSSEENSRWAAAVKPLLEEFVKTTKAKGLPGDEALKFCLDFIKAYKD